MLWQKAIEGVRMRASFDEEKLTPPMCYEWLDDAKWVDAWYASRKNERENRWPDEIAG